MCDLHFQLPVNIEIGAEKQKIKTLHLHTVREILQRKKRQITLFLYRAPRFIVGNFTTKHLKEKKI